MLDGKRCSRCKEWKPSASFNKKAAAKTGLYSHCRDCAKVAQAKYRAENAEKLKLDGALYRALHPKVRKTDRKPRTPGNPVARLARRPRAELSPDELAQVREYDRQKRLANLERYREYSRKHNAKRSAEMAQKLKSWTHQNRELRKAARKEHVDVMVLIDRDRGRCGICHLQVEPGEQSIDHILPITQGGEHSYANTQLAHRRCNQQKGNRGHSQLRMLGGNE